MILMLLKTGYYIWWMKRGYKHVLALCPSVQISWFSSWMHCLTVSSHTGTALLQPLLQQLPSFFSLIESNAWDRTLARWAGHISLVIRDNLLKYDQDARELLHQIIPVQYTLLDCIQPKMELHHSFASMNTMNKLGRQEHGSRYEMLVLQILLFLAALHNH